MEIKRVCALYFSATGNTEKTVATFVETLAEQLGVPWERLPFTKPAERERDYVFADTELVVVGTPTRENYQTRSCRTSRPTFMVTARWLRPS